MASRGLCCRPSAPDGENGHADSPLFLAEMVVVDIYLRSVIVTTDCEGFDEISSPPDPSGVGGRCTMFTGNETWETKAYCRL